MRRRGKWKLELELLRAEIERDQFLQEWLSSANAELCLFDESAAALDHAGRQRAATQAGFRTWRALRSCQRDIHRALEQYVNHPTYAQLWARLRVWDEKHGFMELYGPHNGGVPRSLLRSIETWHRSPKFTAAELARHKIKITKACDELAGLIEQVTPGNFYDKFGTLHLSESEAGVVFDCFASPLKRRHLYGNSSPAIARSAELLLTDAGITPLWALGNIRASAQGGADGVLPTKVRTPTAFRTYMVKEVCDSVAMTASHNALPISDQLIADVVSLLVNMDCSLDDVRKTMMDRRKRELEVHPEDSSS